MTVFDLIVSERRRQDSKWGGHIHDDRHGPWMWGGLIVKQLGRAMMDVENLRPEVFKSHMVKVAALAVAAFEWCERREKRA